MNLIFETIRNHARFCPDDIAVTDGTVTLSYKALAESVEGLKDVLAAKLGSAGPVAYCLDNSAAWVVLDLALTELGVPTVPLPPFFTPAQRQHALGQAGAATLIVEADAVGGKSAEAIALLGHKLHVQPLDACPVDLPPRTAKVTYTSGTTGHPKGVCLSQSGLEQVAVSLVDVIGPEYAGIHCAVLPLAVLLENVAGMYPTLMAGGRYHVPPLSQIGFANAFSPDFPALAQVLHDVNATSSIMVPEILRGLLAALGARSMSLPDMKLVAVGGAKVPRGLLDAARKFELPVFQGYGLSEAASVVAFNTPSRNRPGSVGRLLPHTRVSLASDGEIILSNPALLGYVGEGAAPAEFATGDIGRVDEDGYLYIGGRKSNTLITSFGRNVAPEWVESELLSQPSVGQALVFGESQPALGALIVPSSFGVTDSDLERAVEQANLALPDYARIGHWCKVMPFTPASRQLTENGRLRRAVIHEDYRFVMQQCFGQKGKFVSFFEKLIAETAKEREYLQETPQIRDGLSGNISRQAYLDYLAEAYHHVKHTVPLMKLVDRSLPPEKAWLREAIAHYVDEETGHEQWILDDIENTGGDREAVRAGTPRLATELMVAFAYDYIGRINPIGFFGMVFVLEGTSTQLAMRGAHALMQTLGLTENSFHYLLSHGALDLEHMRFLERLLNRIEDPEDQAAIVHMAKTMFILFANVFRSIPHKAVEARVA